MPRRRRARGRTRERTSEVEVRTRAKTGRAQWISCFQKQKGEAAVRKGGEGLYYLMLKRWEVGQGRGQGKELGFKCSVGSRWEF